MDESYEQKRARSKKQKIIVVCTILGIIAVVVIAIFLIVGLTSSSDDNDFEKGKNIEPSSDEMKSAVTGNEETPSSDKPDGNGQKVPGAVPNGESDVKKQATPDQQKKPGKQDQPAATTNKTGVNQNGSEATKQPPAQPKTVDKGSEKDAKQELPNNKQANGAQHTGMKHGNTKGKQATKESDAHKAPNVKQTPTVGGTAPPAATTSTTTNTTGSGQNQAAPKTKEQAAPGKPAASSTNTSGKRPSTVLPTKPIIPEVVTDPVEAVVETPKQAPTKKPAVIVLGPADDQPKPAVTVNVDVEGIDEPEGVTNVGRKVESGSKEPNPQIRRQENVSSGDGGARRKGGVANATNGSSEVNGSALPGKAAGTGGSSGTGTNASGTVNAGAGPSGASGSQGAVSGDPSIRSNERTEVSEEKESQSFESPQSNQHADKVIYTRKSKYRIFVDHPKYEPDLKRVFNPSRDDIDADFDETWMMDYESIYDIKRDDYIFNRTYGNSAILEKIEPFKCIDFNYPYQNPIGKMTETILTSTSRYYSPSKKSDKFCKITYNGHELIESADNLSYILIFVENIFGMEIISLIGTDEYGTRKGVQFVLRTIGQETVRINNNYVAFLTAITKLKLTGSTAFNAD